MLHEVGAARQVGHGQGRVAVEDGPEKIRPPTRHARLGRLRLAVDVGQHNRVGAERVAPELLPQAGVRV